MKPDPVTKQVWVPLSPDAAFKLFTRDVARWWPLDRHSMSAGQKKAALNLEFEPRRDGRIVETMFDGQTTIWGHFTRFDPPEGLEIAWYVGRTPAEATRIRVDFRPEGNGTQVTLIHDGFEVLGDEGGTVRNGYNGGWDGVLARFEGAAKLPA